MSIIGKNFEHIIGKVKSTKHKHNRQFFMHKVRAPSVRTRNTATLKL
jgi:hypothetical protein